MMLVSFKNFYLLVVINETGKEPPVKSSEMRRSQSLTAFIGVTSFSYEPFPVTGTL